MAKKKSEGCGSSDLHPKEPEFDYVGFSIKFTKLCINLSIKFSKLVYTLSKYTYERIQVWRIDKQLKKLDKEYMVSRDCFDRREVK